jgi:hypothetical protein
MGIASFKNANLVQPRGRCTYLKNADPPSSTASVHGGPWVNATRLIYPLPQRNSRSMLTSAAWHEFCTRLRNGFFLA